MLHFVHYFEVREEFLGFVNCETGVSGESLAEKILDAVRSWNLNLLKRRGQGYDEAANMGGSLNGVLVLFSMNFPKHCIAIATRMP